MNLTWKQAEAITLLKSPAKHVLLAGGARSGKTAVILLALIYRACAYPGSWHLIARWRQSHAKSSIWFQSLLPMLKKYAVMPYVINHSDMSIRFLNGSEIWVGGFDDKERTEKLLGHEYASIYFNEVSQISYEAVILGQSRLAQNISGCTNRAYYDCNPPSPLHWAHKLFIEKRDPTTGQALDRPDLYGYLTMNPMDNIDNLPPNYIQEFLDPLPEKSRRRFKLGEWVKAEGTVFERFDPETMVIPWQKALNCKYEEYTVGLDFGLNMAAVLAGWIGDKVVLLDSYGAFNMTTRDFNKEITRRWGRHYTIAYCDPSGGERIQEVYRGMEANNAVEPGLDFINAKMEHGQFLVSEWCGGWLSEVEDYRRDDKERIVKMNDHFMDAGRYGTFSHRASGIVYA